MVGCKGPFLILGGGDGTGDVIGPAGRLLIVLVATTTYKPVEHHGGIRAACLLAKGTVSWPYLNSGTRCADF